MQNSRQRFTRAEQRRESGHPVRTIEMQNSPGMNIARCLFQKTFELTVFYDRLDRVWNPLIPQQVHPLPSAPHTTGSRSPP